MGKQPCGTALLKVIKAFSFALIGKLFHVGNDSAAKKALDLCGFYFAAAGSGSYDIVVALGEFLLAVFKGGADYSAAAASRHGVADLFSRGNAQSDAVRAFFFIINGDIFSNGISAPLINADENLVVLDFKSIFHSGKSLRQYRTKIVCGLRSQIFCQIVLKIRRHTGVCQEFLVQYDGKYASKTCAKALAVLCAVLP